MKRGTHTHTYTHTEREQERKRERDFYINKHTFTEGSTFKTNCIAEKMQNISFGYSFCMGMIPFGISLSIIYIYANHFHACVCFQKN